jgi:hypothetical protein
MGKATVTLEPLHHIEDRLNHVVCCLNGIIELIDQWINMGGNTVPDTGVVLLVHDQLESKAELLQELSDLALAVRCGKAVA